MNDPKLVIFDMDGLMFDTENIAYEAWKEAAEKFNFSMDRAIADQFIGTTGENIVRMMSDIYGAEAPVAEWRQYQQQVKAKKVDENITKKGFKKKGLDILLAYLKDNNTAVCVASCSEAYKINKLLKETQSLQYIDFTIAGDEVTCGKPNPEIFRRACKEAKVLPEQALVLEDSLSGIRAASAAGIPAFFIPDRIIVNQEIKDKAAGVFDSLEDVAFYFRSIKK